MADEAGDSHLTCRTGCRNLAEPRGCPRKQHSPRRCGAAVNRGTHGPVFRQGWDPTAGTIEGTTSAGNGRTVLSTPAHRRTGKPVRPARVSCRRSNLRKRAARTGGSRLSPRAGNAAHRPGARIPPGWGAGVVPPSSSLEVDRESMVGRAERARRSRTTRQLARALAGITRNDTGR